MRRTVPLRQPLTGLALSAVAGILLSEFVRLPIATLGFGLLCTALFSLVRPGTGLTHLLVAAGFFALHQLQLTASPGHQLNARLGASPRTVVVTGTVTSDPRISPNDFSTFFLRLDSIALGDRPEPSRATVRVRWKGNPKLGDEIRLRGLAEPIAPTRNPGAFDLRAYLARNDIFHGLFARYPEDGTILRPGGAWLARAAARARTWMRTTLDRGLEDSPEVVALINGMALGQRHETPHDIEEPFQQTGTLHLFAVAGLHVGIIAQLLWIVASLVRLPRVAAAALIIPSLFFYSMITGFHVSSVRAATMAAVLLGGIFFQRPVLALNSLAGAALLILLADPNQLFTSGFQLSFAVVGAILIGQERIFRELLRPAEPDPFLPRSLVSRTRRCFLQIYRWIAGGISVSAAAWVGSLLFIIWYFYLITPISLLANLMVIPIAFGVLAVGLLSLVAAPFSTALSLVFNNANWSLCHFILGLVQLFARLPTGHLYVERPHWPTGVRTEITVLDAGAGAAVHLRTAGRDWLLDAGSTRDYDRLLRDYLHSRGIDRLDGLVLSHGDSLHLGGANALLEEFRPRRLLDNGAPDRSSVHRAIIDRYREREIVAHGSEWLLSNRVRARVLYPPPGSKAKAADDQALVLQLVIGNKYRILLVSDSGPATEEELLKRPNELRSNILIKGQNYSGVSGSPEFLAAVQPQVVVATSVDFPARERIPDAWAAEVRARGIRLFRQDETGAVKLEFFRDHWRATGFVNHESLRSASR
ncbi:MAG: ComEC/Rec2 family competence protein [Verrucomicrobiota bacterium]|nr:ComEC/Rec2 family competence protein [Verrucomicrobiota bacterium]